MIAILQPRPILLHVAAFHLADPELGTRIPRRQGATGGLELEHDGLRGRHMRGRRRHRLAGPLAYPHLWLTRTPLRQTRKPGDIDSK